MRHPKRRRAIILAVGILLSVFAFLLLYFDADAILLNLLRFSHATWQKPAVFGTFHLCFLVGCILLTVLLSCFGAGKGRAHTDEVLFAAGLVLFALEVYKQFYSYFVLQNREYDFGFFPLQFCSLPMYLFLLIPLMREGKTKEAFCRFLALYGVMGGCLVMGYPAWFEEIPLCVHTMLWHTVMISVGTYLLFAKNYGRRYLREMLPATAVFLGSVALATACNLLLTPLTCESPNPLNLYYMNPRVGKTHYFLIGDVWKTLGWGPAMFAYVLLFIFVGATLVFGVARAIHWFSDARRNGKIPSFSKK